MGRNNTIDQQFENTAFIFYFWYETWQANEILFSYFLEKERNWLSFYLLYQIEKKTKGGEACT